MEFKPEYIGQLNFYVTAADKLLRRERYLADTGYRFWPAGDWDLGTRTAGYSRHTVAYYYIKVY